MNKLMMTVCTSPRNTALALLVLYFATPTATAQVVEPGTTQHHLRALQYFIGTWEFVGSEFDRKVTGTITWKWDLNQNILVRKIHVVPEDGSQPAVTSMFVVLWDAKHKRLLERGFGGYGGYGQSTWTQHANGWSQNGLGSWILWNGEQGQTSTVYTITNKNEFIVNGTFNKHGAGVLKTTLKATRVDTSTNTSVTHSNTQAWWKFYEGAWTTTWSTGTVVDVTFSLSANKEAMIGHHITRDGVVSSSLFGWDPKSQIAVGVGFGSAKNYWVTNYEVVTKNEMSGPLRGVTFEGTTFEGHFTAKKVDGNTIDLTLSGKDDKGEEVTIMGQSLRTSTN